MFRPLTIAALLATSVSTAANAQSSQLNIAFVKAEGSGATIYLTNESGSQTVKLYSTPAKTTIGSMDLKPNGGEIAFIERKSGAPWGIKVLTFNSVGLPGGTPRALKTPDGSRPCYPDSLDYHPTEPVLIFSDVCNQVMNIARIGTDGSGYQMLQQSPAPPPNEWWFSSPRWLKDGVSYVYARAVNASGQQLCRDACETPLWSGYQVGRMDVGRITNRVLFDAGGNFISELDADTGAILRSNLITGFGGHYAPDAPANPDDIRILYATPREAKGNYLQIRNGNGTHTRITPKGDYATSDWRP